MQKLIYLFKLINSYQPFSIRGLCFLVLALGSLFFIAIPESDLVSYILSGLTLILMGLALIVAIGLRVYLGRNLRVELLFDTLNNTAKTQVPASIHVVSGKILPFFRLFIKRNFSQEGVRTFTHELKGIPESNQKRIILDTVYFPHRGSWTIKEIDLRLEDGLGLISFPWRIPENVAVDVSAQTIAIEPLPVMAASSRAGDRLNFSKQRTGDPFDIKAYEPSDGIKRILWKNFARSGELVVRRPEPAILPEGEVAIYLVAKRHDDFVAGALQSYLKQLDDAQVTVVFGTDEMPDGLAFSSDEAEIQKTINSSAFSPEAGSGVNFANFLEGLENLERSIAQVVVFAADDQSSSWLNKINVEASTRSIKVSLALVSENIDPNSLYGAELKKKSELLGSFLSKKNIVNKNEEKVGVVAGKFGAEVIHCKPMHRF